MSALQVTTAPASEPLTLAVVKAHLRVDHAADDALLADLIVAVRQLAELYTGRAFMTQTLTLWADAAPAGASFSLPRAPLQNVVLVRTYDGADGASLMPASSYYVDVASQPGRIVLREGAAWPLALRTANAFEVQFVAGYGSTAAAVPLALRQGMLCHLAHLYENRGDGVDAALPAQALALYAPYRLLRGVAA